MKKLLISMFIVIMLSTSVFASAEQIWSDDEAAEYIFSITLHKGWNLISSFTHPDDVTFVGGSITKSDIIAVYALLPNSQQYARLFPDLEADKLSEVGDEFMLQNSFWVYSSKTGDLQYKTEPIQYLKSRQMFKGWNFVSVTPEYQGKNMDDLIGNCDIQRVYFYNAEEDETERGTNWKPVPMDLEIPEDLVGLGLIVKVTNDCTMGDPALSVTPPQIPSDLADQENVTTTTPKCMIDAGVTCLDIIITTNQIQMMLQSDFSYDLRDVSISIEGCNDKKEISSFTQREIKTLTFSCDVGAKGTVFDEAITIDYTPITSGMPHTIKGEIADEIK